MVTHSRAVRWYRVRFDSVIYWIFGSVLIGVAISSATVLRSKDGLVPWPFTLFGLAVGTFVITRLALGGIRVTDSGIAVRNPLSTKELAWSDIRAFSIHQRSDFARNWTIYVDLADAGAVAVDVLARPLSGNPGGPPPDLERLCAELNGELASSRR